ncbi:MAG: hypothetical protein OSB55_14880 [Verrucomicrobiota bacterium]|nr:hypothetical protein [Verrucomicrobiota bacterium]
MAKLGITVHDEASAAAANTPGSASHGPSHPTGKAEAKEGNVLFYGVLPNLKKHQQEPHFRELYKKINHPLYVD